MDGVVIDLLKTKWDTFVKSRFYKQFYMFAFYFLFSLASFILRPGPLVKTSDDENGNGNGNGNDDDSKNEKNHDNQNNAVRDNDGNRDNIVTVVVYANSTIAEQSLLQPLQQPQHQINSIHNFIELFNIDNSSTNLYSTANKQSYRKFAIFFILL